MIAHTSYMKKAYKIFIYTNINFQARTKRSCIGANHIMYNHQLLKEKRWNLTNEGFIAELFEPYGSMDYCYSKI